NNYVSEKCGVLLFLGSLTALFLQMQYFRCVFLPASHVLTLTYQSDRTNGVGFEVRRYDAAKYAAVYSEGRTYEQVIGELVRKLLTYIGGNNEQAMGIAFPIIITVYPRNDGVFSRRLAVGIRIPNAYQQDPPAPTDSTIRVEERPGMTVYALYVSFVTVYLIIVGAARLTRALGETTPFQRKQYFCCSYDPPLKPYGRRNEVWLLQEDP
uniref:Heme-binding protein 1 n=1 Tax=Poecilia latipinna TaxID=48699 RepID=A0A3B3VDF7_9TELE